MTITVRAMILAMFFNTAFDQQIEKFEARQSPPPTDNEIVRNQGNGYWAMCAARVQSIILKEISGPKIPAIYSTELR